MRLFRNRPRKVQAIFIAAIVVAIFSISAAITTYAYSSQVLIPHVLGTGNSCGAYGVPVSVVDANGFSHMSRLYRNQSGFFEFVIKPNETGYITMAYDFGNVNPPIYFLRNLIPSSTQSVLTNEFHTTMSQYFGSQEIRRLDYNNTENLGTEDALIYIPSARDVGLDIDASNIENVTQSIVKVTYAIHADPSAERGTYLLDLKICPGELLTVGDEPHQGPLPWDEREGHY